MSIVWTPNLSVGVEHIDDQHKKWFEKANALFEAGKKRRAKDYINTMLDFLDEYTKQHFRDEEAYMKKIKHKAQSIKNKTTSISTTVSQLKVS